VCWLAAVAPAAAQRLSFERTFTVDDATVLDVSTIRGAVEVQAGEAGRVHVAGTVTVRVAGPADALAIAQRIAANPPVQHEASTVRLRAPLTAAERGAVTVAYVVRVPRTMRVSVVSESGALTIREVGGGATIRSQSGAIEVRDLAGPANVTSQSGAVQVDGVAGALTVETSSGAMTIAGVGGALQASTQSGRITATDLRGGATFVSQSGAVRAVFTGQGAVSARSQSGAIEVRNVDGAATLESQSGGMTIAGLIGALQATTQSGFVTATDVRAGATIGTRTGEVRATFSGAHPVTVRTQSGAITLGGVTAGLEVQTQSGRVNVDGEPGRGWQIDTGSASVALTLAPSSKARLDLVTKSSSIVADDPAFVGSFTKRHVTAEMNGGGPHVRVTTRSGSIRARAAGGGSKG
jgi:DUF4097 and DUF4098 domain-containing protein YvlB